MPFFSIFLLLADLTKAALALADGSDGCKVNSGLGFRNLLLTYREAVSDRRMRKTRGKEK